MALEDAVEFDKRDAIREYLEKEERTLAWLSRKTGINYGTLYYCLIHRLFKISDVNLKKINEALGTDFK